MGLEGRSEVGDCDSWSEGVTAVSVEVSVPFKDCVLCVCEEGLDTERIVCGWVAGLVVGGADTGREVCAVLAEDVCTDLGGMDSEVVVVGGSSGGCDDCVTTR